MDGGHRTGVTGIHRLEQVERFTTANLPDDQPVRPEPQRGDHQVADRKFPLAVLVRLAGFEVDAVLLLKLKFAGILQHEDAVLGRNESA